MRPCFLAPTAHELEIDAATGNVAVLLLFYIAWSSAMQFGQFAKYRTIVVYLLAFVGLLAAVAGSTANGGESDSLVTVQPGVRQLFLDDGLVQSRERLERVVNPVTKHPANPLIAPEKPWEAGVLMVNNSVAYDELAGQFKMWCLIPSFATQGERRTAFFTSSDGLKWKRPELGLVNYSSSDKNNLIPANLSHVVYDPPVQGIKPAGPRFKGIGWGGAPPGQYAAFSEDGLQWTISRDFRIAGAVGDVFDPSRTAPIQELFPLDPKVAPAEKFQVVRKASTREPAGSVPRYFAIIRQMERVGQFDRRVLTITTSDDFLQWSNPRIVLKPDAEDDKLAETRIANAKPVLGFDHPDDHRCEFYSMLGFHYEGLYLGLMGVFDATFDRTRIGLSNQDGPRHVELVFSRDLQDWHRLPGRVPFIPIGGKEGDWDAGMIGYTATPIVVGEQIHIYYGGQRLTHGGRWLEELEKYRAGTVEPLSSIGLATLRRDGFVSLNAGDEPGTLLTKPFRLPPGPLHLNVDAHQGEVSVVVLSRGGEAIAGFERSTSIQGDHQDVQVLWPGGQLDQLHDKIVRLKITAKNARLFSFWF